MKLLFRTFAAGLAVIAACSAQAGEPVDLVAAARALHVLNRLGYGPKPGDVERVAAIGVDRYIATQLDPKTIPLPEALSQRLLSLTATQTSARQAMAQFYEGQAAARQDDEAGKQQRREIYERMSLQTAEARLARAIDSPRQLDEVMVDFWFNHFNVFSGKSLDRALIASYERDAIRPFAMGRFRDLLGATSRHPAMLFYLDNWLSVAPGSQPAQRGDNAAAPRPSGLNENFARELMELHTLGVDGGFSQKDVTELARMFTGWTFAPRAVRGDGDFQFDPRRHDNGEKFWLGQRISARGRDEGEWALDLLAAHPATARHISYKLAQYFVADQPPAALVDRLARRFQETQGDIRAVLGMLFASPEFRDPGAIGGKFKTPYQYVVSAARAADLRVLNVRPLLSTLAQLGMPLYGCQTPDGYKNTEAAWLNPDALTRRINFATALASGRLPLDQPADGAANRPDGAAVNAVQLLDTLGPSISARTRSTVGGSQPALRAALVLGSPDFMRH